MNNDQVKISIIVFGLILMLVLPFDAPAKEKIFFACDDYPPYGYLEDGKPVGIVADIVKEVCKRIGIEPDIHVLPWRRALTEAKIGKAYGLFALFRTPERAKFFYYPDTHVSYEKGIVVARKNSGLKVADIDGLRNLTVGVVYEYSYEPVFDSYKGFRKDYSEDMVTLLKKLDAKRMDVALTTELGFKYVSRKLKMTDRFEILEYVRSENPLYVGFSKAKGEKARILSEKFGKFLKIMWEDGTIEIINQRYRFPDN